MEGMKARRVHFVFVCVRSFFLSRFVTSLRLVTCFSSFLLLAPQFLSSILYWNVSSSHFFRSLILFPWRDLERRELQSECELDEEEEELSTEVKVRVFPSSKWLWSVVNDSISYHSQLWWVKFSSNPSSTHFSSSSFRGFTYSPPSHSSQSTCDPLQKWEKV